MKKWTNTNPMRRLLSLALSIVMVLSLLPAGALAEEPVLDEPVQEELVQEQPVQEGPEKEEPVQEEPEKEEPEKEEPVQEEPVEQEPEQKQESEQEPVVKTEPAEEEAQSASTDAVITDWEWDDGYEIVDEESGYVVLPFTGEEFASSLDDVKGMLPEAILVGEEALTLGNWTYETGEEGAVVTIDSESCPSPGSFKTTLPEGYVLADGTNVLSLTVALSAGSSEGTSSYADSDTLTNVPYYDANGTLKTCPSATKVVKNMDKDGPNTTWTTGWYVVEGTVEIGGEIHTDPNDLTKTEILYKSVSVQGDVNLILKEGSELQMLHGHIDVPKGSSLTVYCDNTSNSGTLKVWGAINHAAIGGSPDSPDSGRITINGGTVTAHTGNGGAGIGSGEGGSAGDITINGGNIEATANYGGAAIGTGKNGKSATITIKNCQQIYARSSSGAGIGSGEGSSGTGKVTVNINDGTGIISKSASGAGIGSGENAPLSVDVNINGGDIYAQTTGQNDPYNHGAAIGGGYGATNTTVKIGGTAEVDAHGGENAPGIGSIDPGGCSVTISGGTVRAWGGKRAAGIGGGSLKQTSCPVTITGGNVTATGGDIGAGIGSGSGDSSKATPYSTGTIIISDGTVTAEGSYWAAGIGGGAYCTAGQIQINGGTVIAKRNTANDNDVRYKPEAIGDGGLVQAQNPSNVRFELNNGAKVYLQTGIREPASSASGYVFDGTPETYTAIRVYGSQTLNEDFCIEKDKTMTVMSGATLNTGNYGIYVQNGGTLTRDGTVNGNIYYPLTLTGCTASGNTSTYGDSNDLFGKAGSTITLTPTLPSGYKLVSWEVTPPSSVSVSDYSFTMPNQKTTVEAKGTQVLQITQQPQNQEITYGADATLSVTAKNDSGTTDGISYKWYVDGVVKGTGSTLSLSNLDAGSHSCYCQVSCDGVSMNSNTVTVKVNKAQASVTIDSNPGKTYDGTPVATPGYTVISGGGYPKIEYKLQSKPDTDYKETAPTDAGEYTVRVTIPDSENYITGYATKDFTISKATDNKWRTEPSVTNFTYGDTETNPVTYEAKYGNGNVVVTYKKQGTEGTSSTTVPTDAGTYDVTVSLAGTASYPGLADENLTLTIAKAASSVTTAPTDAQSLYTGGNVPLVNAGTTGDGTMQYSLDGENWSENIPTATDWKTYTVYYQVVGDSNHNNIEAQSLTAEIVPFEIQTQPQPVTIDYGNDAEMSVTLDTILSDITYQWYQLTDEGDVELTDATESTLTLTKPIAGGYTYVCKITCGEYSATSAEAVVTVNAVSQPLPTTDLPDGLWAEGGEEPLNGDSIDLKSPSSRLLTKYTEGKNTQGDPYPAGMQIYSVEKDDQGQTVVVPVAELDNLLQYSGCSIRINGKPGIRMITSLTKQAKAALKKGELAGYTLEEYGTVVAWSKELGNNPLTLSTGSSNYAYRKGVSDPVFANVGNLTQYTNVLVWDSLPDEKYAKDIAMRPYIILSKDGETVTLYGGTVSRSIGYVAQQNADTFPKGSAGYKYVHDIIDRVNKLTNNSQQS